MKKPTRWNSDHTHREYGIRNWFNLIGVKNHEDQKRLKIMWLEDQGFKDNGRTGQNLRFTQNVYIGARWEIFARYVQKNLKYFYSLKAMDKELTYSFPQY